MHHGQHALLASDYAVRDSWARLAPFGAVPQSVDEDGDHALAVGESLAGYGQAQKGDGVQEFPGAYVGTDFTGHSCGFEQRPEGGCDSLKEVAGQGVERWIARLKGRSESSFGREEFGIPGGATSRVLLLARGPRPAPGPQWRRGVATASRAFPTEVACAGNKRPVRGGDPYLDYYANQHCDWEAAENLVGDGEQQRPEPAERALVSRERDRGGLPG